ncbi:hypothetical protein BH10PLA2_BH10PLA2_36390 [soil metagenome]
MVEQDADQIRKQMANTRCSISEKLDLLERRVVDTVEGATHAVNDTVETVRDTVRDSVHSMQTNLDPIRQADRHPWTTFAVCLGAGYAVGKVLEGGLMPRSAVIDQPKSWPHPSPSTEAASHATHQNGAPSAFVRNFIQPLEPDMRRLKEMGIGMLFGVVRDFLHDVAPEPMRDRLHEVVDDVTRRMGGEPVKGPVLEGLRSGTKQGFESACSRERKPTF